MFVGCTNEKYLVLFRGDCKERIAEFPVIDEYCTSITISNTLNCIFMGTNKGNVRVSVWPLGDKNMEYDQINSTTNKVVFKQPDYFQIPAHSAPITSMILTHDSQYLITGDEEGVIFILKVKEVYQDG